MISDNFKMINILLILFTAASAQCVYHHIRVLGVIVVLRLTQHIHVNGCYRLYTRDFRYPTTRNLSICVILILHCVSYIHISLWYMLQHGNGIQFKISTIDSPDSTKTVMGDNCKMIDFLLALFIAENVQCVHHHIPVLSIIVVLRLTHHINVND